MTASAYWFIYLLHNSRINRTYVGATTDPPRRLRQHNREIRGGARSTEYGSPDWRMIAILEGFTSKRDTLRWEKLLKLRCRGIVQRLRGMVQISRGECPEYPRANRKRRGVVYTPPPNISLKFVDQYTDTSNSMGDTDNA